MSLTIKKSSNLKFMLILFSLFFVIFLFTSDGHRFSFDEDVAAQQSKRIATFSPDPSYVQGESRLFFEYPWLYPPEHNQRPVCLNAILCSHGTITHSLTQVPFIFINHNFNFIETDNLWTTDDFDDFHYVAWRNSIDDDFTFMELFYGPFFSALSVCVFFLISKTYGYSVRTSLILVFLYGLSTTLWAYSQTSLNVVPFVFFLLTGFLFYRKFHKTNSYFNLILTGIFFGVAFLTRQDGILIIIPLFILLLITSFKKKMKLKTFFAFSIPVIISYGIHRFVEFVRIGIQDTAPSIITVPSQVVAAAKFEPIHMYLFGILFSPGAGIFVYAPILLASFVGFFDFYKKNKFDCFLFISFIAFFLMVHGTNVYWHGFNGWGTRYFLPLFAFLILPLGASIEKRIHFSFKLSIISLAIAGFLVNLIYLLQDVSYFVWGFFGSDVRGLYSLARKADGNVHDLWINPVIIWTFEFSQILQSALWLVSKPQFDLFLLKIFGPELFIASLVLIIPFLLYLLLKKSKTYVDIQKNS